MNAELTTFNSFPDRGRTEFFSFSSASPYRVTTNSGRVVTLASFSNQIPGEQIALRLGHSVQCITGSSVLLVQFTTRDGSIPVKDWPKFQPEFGSGFCFSQQLERHGGSNRLTLQLTGAPQEASFLAPMLTHFTHYFRYVIFSLP